MPRISSPVHTLVARFAWCVFGLTACGPEQNANGSSPGQVDAGPADGGVDSAQDVGTPTEVAAAEVADLPQGDPLEFAPNAQYLTRAVQVIQTAKKRLDIIQFETTSYQANSGDVVEILVNAVLNAKKRGVTVRVLFDNEISNNQLLVDKFKAVGIAASLDSPSLRTHAKIVYSEQGAVIGSTNWSWSSIAKNNETNVLVRDPTALTALGTYINTLMVKSSSPVSIKTSTNDQLALYGDGGYAAVIAPLLKAAKTRVILCTYGMNTDSSEITPSLDLLAAAAKRGVKIRAVLDQSADWGDPQVNLDAGKVLAAFGAEVRNDPISVITHAKFLIIDNTLVMGSNNWGYGGFKGYHEVGVRTSTVKVVGQVVDYFEKLWIVSTPIQ